MLERFSERLVKTPPKRLVGLDVRIAGNSATIWIGERSFDLSSNAALNLTHENYDFALFGAAAVAIRNNWDIQTDLPISYEAAAAVRTVSDILDTWRVRRCYPVRFQFNNLVRTAASQKRRGLICLSGGVDSTWAALEKADQGLISHGVLIAGADYPSRNHTGFVDLENRVQKIAEHIGIRPIIAETTIRNFKLYWPISHVFVLAMVLSFHSSFFGRGYIAADFTLAQEFGYHPWGNCRPLVDALGQTDFTIEQAGQLIGRTEKLASILQAKPELTQHVSVCYSHKDSGENCGVCEKCIRTKLNFAASNLPYTQYFLRNSTLEGQVSKLPLPKTQAGLRRHMVFLKDVLATLPDGDLSQVLRNRTELIRKATVPLGKI